MILLEEVGIEMPAIIGFGKKMSEEQIRKYNEAKEEFVRRLNSSSSGKNMVAEIYKLLNQFTSEYLKNHRIACGEKCSYCCRQLVCCTTLEMGLIADYIQTLPRVQRRPVMHKAKMKAVDFCKKNHSILTSAARWEEVASFLRNKHHGVPCIFLRDRKCSIYPVRPIDCRIAKTSNPCGRERELALKPQNIRLFCDQVASDLIMKEEEKCYGKMQVVPLIGWPITPEFDHFFK